MSLSSPSPAPNGAGVVIAGGGLAGQRCAETLRRRGYDGPIRMLCAETHRPYTRPPLSKGLLTEADGTDRLAFRSADWYADHDVELRPGAAAVGLRPAEREVLLADGRALRYGVLLVATGSRPRRLPGFAGMENVSVLHELEDALTLREQLRPGGHLVIVGAGFIGLEIAASARALGVEVTLIEAASQPLVGVLGPELGAWFAGLHRRHGVRVLTGQSLRDVVGAAGRVEMLVLEDGTRLEPDWVVIAVGTAPATQWLEPAGLAAPEGVRVDAVGQSADRRVFAAGDAAAHRDRSTQRYRPGTHWEAAARQGSNAALAMLGEVPEPASATMFWTDQYDLRIQYVGSSRADDTVRLDGDLEAEDFSATFLREQTPVGVLLVNRPRALAAARQLIEKGTS